MVHDRMLANFIEIVGIGNCTVRMGLLYCIRASIIESSQLAMSYSTSAKSSVEEREGKREKRAGALAVPQL